MRFLAEALAGAFLFLLGMWFRGQREYICTCDTWDEPEDGIQPLDPYLDSLRAWGEPDTITIPSGAGFGPGVIENLTKMYQGWGGTSAPYTKVDR